MTAMSDVQRILYLLVTAIVVGVISVIVTFIYLVQITGATKQQSEDNFKVLTLQIPGLQKEITRLEKENNDLDYILSKQAIPAIVHMIGQIETLGGDPPPVLLEESEPPFNPER